MSKLKFIAACVAVLLFSSVYAATKTVVVKLSPKGEDATLSVLTALKEVRKTKATKLVFEKGDYTFLPNLAPERYFFVSNNDESLKRFLFDLTDIKNLEIDGQGSHFILDGYLSPFLLNFSKNITVKNLSFDYKRTFHSEGKIIASYKDSIDVEFSSEYPYFVDNNKLMFTGDKYITMDCAGKLRKEFYPFWHLLEFKASTSEPHAGLEYLPVQNMIVKEIKPGVVRLFYPRMSGVVGNTMIFNAEYRSVPGFIISDSENTKILNVTIYHAGGMGVIGQRSKDIFLDSVKVIAPEGRMVSVTADATHFVHCYGKITMQNCIFESMMDDATNIHGIYMKIEKIISPTEILVKRMHYMQFGFDIFKPKSNIEIVNPRSLNTKSEYVVKAVERYNKEYIRLVLTKPIAEDIKLGDAVASIDYNPEVLMTHCVLQKNRGRNMLLGSRGKTIIENNYLRSHAASITLEGDARFWFEQAGVRDLIIRNNTFDNCNYGFMFGVGVLFTGSGIEEDEKQNSKYNRNIVFENNIVNTVGPNILNLYSVDNVLYRNNKVTKSTNPEYTISADIQKYFESIKLGRFKIVHSTNIKIEE